MRRSEYESDAIFPLRSVVRIAVVCSALSLCACASTRARRTEDDPYQVNDPIEPVNRGIFTVNVAARRLRHASRPPRPITTCCRDAVRDCDPQLPDQSALARSSCSMTGCRVRASSPATRSRGSGSTRSSASAASSTSAPDAGIPFHDSDFGQTFGVWGVPAGPYLVLPLLGPSDPRDAVGARRRYARRSDRTASCAARATPAHTRNTAAPCSPASTSGRVTSISSTGSAARRSTTTRRSVVSTVSAARREIRHEAPPEANPALSRLPEQDAASRPAIAKVPELMSVRAVAQFFVVLLVAAAVALPVPARAARSDAVRLHLRPWTSARSRS